MPWILLILTLSLSSITAFAEIDAGGAGADTVFVSPLHSPQDVPEKGIRSGDSIRAAVTVDPMKIGTYIGEAILLPMEVQAGMSVGTQQLELTRYKASLLRAKFSSVMPVHLLSVYRNLDRGIDAGFDVIGFRVPVRITKNAGLVVLPGMELGVRHYSAPVDTTALHASFIIEARAARTLVKDWATAGLMGRIRYDLDTAVSGFEEGAMGYLSFLLDEDHRLYARVYTGIEHQASRDELGLPTLNWFSGLGFYGEFSERP